MCVWNEIETVLGENSLKSSQDFGVVDQYIYSATTVRLISQHKEESEAISLTSHRVYILKIDQFPAL